MRVLDRLLPALLIPGAIGHTLGALQYYRDRAEAHCPGLGII